MAFVYRVAQKKTEQHTSVYEVIAPEKNDTKISNFGSVVCCLGLILSDNFEIPKFYLFSLN